MQGEERFNILVTGCGGDIGQSIGKILNELPLVNQLYGCDISEKNAARFIFRNFYVGLPCSDANYINSLKDFVLKRNIDIIIPASEPELRFLAQNKILVNIGKGKLLISSLKALEIGFDKLRTIEFLKENGLPFPKTVSINNYESVKRFPVIVKSRIGSGSSSVKLIKNSHHLDCIKKVYPDYVVQEYLSDSSGEYTCGLFRSRDNIIRTIIFKRELMGGFSGYGEVIEDKRIDVLLHAIATKLGLVGSINVQLRINGNKPVVFEINPRFSSTVRFRDLFGFKDLEWSLQDLVNQPISGYVPASVGRQFFKGFNEYIT